MMNGIKKEKKFPDFVCFSNICSIYKSKGSRDSIDNERGIFLLSSFKKIFENLLLNDFSKEIEDNMSESNTGARKGRNIKDHQVEAESQHTPTKHALIKNCEY